MNNKKVTARCPASCGELIQGIIKGREMLVSYPVNMYSTVSVELNPKGSGVVRHPKVRKALELLLQKHGNGMQISNMDVKVETRLPLGKGMASSTADVASALCAAAAILDVDLDEEEISKIAVAVEPTDSIIFKNLTLYDHLKGEYKENLGEVPDFRVLAVEGRGRVSTLAFRKDSGYINLVSSRDKAYQKLLEGIQNKSIVSIGEAATESALLNQQLLYKSYLEELIQVAYKYGASGVNIAHSGTVCGIICKRDLDMEKLKHEIDKRLGANFVAYHLLNTVKGGPEIIE